MKKLKNKFLLGTAFSIVAAGVILSQTNCGVYGPPPDSYTESTEESSSAEDNAPADESVTPEN